MVGSGARAARAFAFALVLALASTAAPRPALSAGPSPFAPKVERNARRTAERLAKFPRAKQVALLRRMLARHAEPARGTYYHQVRNPEHRAHWQQKVRKQGLAAMGEWLDAGTYPGIWTLKESAGWYSKATAGKPFAFRLKKDALFFDRDSPQQELVYETWKALTPTTASKDPSRPAYADGKFTGLRNAKPGIGAPKEARFLRELGIAGVVHYDTYGRACPVILNPEAVRSIEPPR